MRTIVNDEPMRYHAPTIEIIRPEIFESPTPRLKYGNDGPPVTATSSGSDGTISGEMMELAEIILDALQQLPVFKFAESLMATKGSRPGDATAAGLNADGATPAPSAMQAAKPVARDPQPVRHSKAIVDSQTVAKYSRCLADAKNQKLTYSKRESSLLEARKIHATTTKAIAAQAIKRSLTLGQSYERSMMELGESPLAPLPATLAAA